jgi:hypothetical protein
LDVNKGQFFSNGMEDPSELQENAISQELWSQSSFFSISETQCDFPHSSTQPETRTKYQKNHFFQMRGKIRTRNDHLALCSFLRFRSEARKVTSCNHYLIFMRQVHWS